MSKPLNPTLGFIVTAVLATTYPAAAQLTIPGANGSDGAFAPSGATFIVDLAQASTAAWDATSPVSGKGVYDPDKWAVVFHYTSVIVPSGTTVKFANHPSGAPVVWLVSGSVTIGGTLNLNGDAGCAGPPPCFANASPGPGGFYGGTNTLPTLPASGGFGPGGGNPANGPTCWGGAGAYGSTGSPCSGITYGNAQLLPLIGGSGGPGTVRTTSFVGNGGAGGGAILLAAASNITVNGTILANGGIDGGECGCGSGGAVRLVADHITGPLQGAGSVRAVGGSHNTCSGFCAGSDGGVGRIRIEANLLTGSLSFVPPTAPVQPPNPPAIWPPATAPIVRVVSVGGVAAPDDPVGIFGNSQTDIIFDNLQAVPVVVETNNIDPAATVVIRVAPAYGTPSTANAAHMSGNYASSTWSTDIVFPQGLYAVQVRVVLP